jgi:DNA repair protein RecO (recombination protein O)
VSTPARAYKTLAVVLRGRNLGEADRIVTLFTTARGKVDAVAKGVRRQKSHLAGRLEFATEVNLSMHRGRTLDVIVAAEIERAHWSGIVRPHAYAAACVVTELIDAFCEPDLAMPEVYDLLTGAIAAIGASDAPTSLIARFSLRLLGALGLAPPADSCVRCGAPFSGKGAWLDSEQGGLAGVECRAASRDSLELTAADLENFRALGARKGGELRAAVQANASVAKAIDALVNAHLGRRPKAGAHAAEFVTG